MPPLNPVFPRERLTQEMVDELVAPEMPPPLSPSSKDLVSVLQVPRHRPHRGPVSDKSIIAPGTQPTVITRGPARSSKRSTSWISSSSSTSWRPRPCPGRTSSCRSRPVSSPTTRSRRARPVRHLAHGPQQGGRAARRLQVRLRVLAGPGLPHGLRRRLLERRHRGLHGLAAAEPRHHHEGAAGASGGHRLQPKPPQFEKFEQMFSTPSLRSRGSRICRRARWPSTTPPTKRTASARCRNGWSRPRARRATPELLELSPDALRHAHHGRLQPRLAAQRALPAGGASRPVDPHPPRGRRRAGSRMATGSSWNRPTAPSG